MSRSLLYLAFVADLLACTQANAAFDHGEVLLNQLSCTTCHQASPQAQGRFSSADGPRLGSAGLRLTPQWLRAFLAQPDEVHPGSSMPDLLHALPPDRKTAAVEDLTQYLVSREGPADQAFDCPPGLIEKGRSLYQIVGCVACHAPFELPPRATDDSRTRAEFQNLAASSQPLAALAPMTSVQQLAAFLVNPVREHPSGRMPSLKLTSSEATAIAAYLLAAQAPKSSSATETVPGLTYHYYEKRFANLPNFERLFPTSAGTIPTFEISPRTRNDFIAFRFQGNIQIPAAGTYRFFSESDDGSKLLIDGKLVVINDGIHAMLEKDGAIPLTQGSHTITLLYFNAEGELGLKVSWAGPGIVKQEIPASVLSHPGVLMRPAGDQPLFKPDPAAAARGQTLYAQLNCAACHQGEGTVQKAKPLTSLTLNGSADCLSPSPAPGLPRYALTAGDRSALRNTLRDPSRLSAPLDPHAMIDRTMWLLNCFACHQRDDQGGPQGLRRDYFTSIPADLDLGDEGRLPPRLTGAGAKLQQRWIGSVLWDGSSVRPYMATRMPQFGHDNVGFLPAAFQAADGAGVSNPNLQGNLSAQKEGRMLVGITGLACIACHNFGGHSSLGIPALDLTVITERLQTGWFHNYLIDPQSLRPGTRMPSFWPDGKAVNKVIAGGNTDRQIAALWTYLSGGSSADLPDGIIQPKMELVPDNRAVMYRNFIQGVGPRAIGVGYPEKANLAFDAGDLRLALIWQGSFIDAGKHRTARGMGTTPPLGHDLLAGPPGPPLALLSGTGQAWPSITGKSAGYQFRGYQLDDLLRPAFFYDFAGVHVIDYPVATPGKEGAGLKRTLTFESANPPANLFFRAAVGQNVAPAPGGGFIVDHRLVLRFGAPSDSVNSIQRKVEAPLPVQHDTGVIVREIDGKMELLAPIRFVGDKARIEEDFSW